jgi:hypothetical protein
MPSKKNLLIEEALMRVNGFVAVLNKLQKTTRGGAKQAEICHAMRAIRSRAEELRRMKRPGDRHSVSSVATVMAGVLDALVEFLRGFPPET